MMSENSQSCIATCYNGGSLFQVILPLQYTCAPQLYRNTLRLFLLYLTLLFKFRPNFAFSEVEEYCKYQ